MSEFVIEANQISVDWLEKVLKITKDSGLSRIRHVSSSHEVINTGSAIQIQITYENEQHILPTHLFLKIGRRYSEVSFFQDLQPYMADVALVPCYHALFLDEQGQSNLLFKNISESHFTRESALPPSKSLLNRFVEIIATVHKIWWEHPDLLQSPLKDRCDDLPGFVLNQVIPQFGRFVDVMDDALSPRRREAYEQILASLPLSQVLKRLESHNAVTVVHGDTHFKNFALPRTSSHPIYLQDWALWHINLPPYDLAYMLARTHPEFRNRIEEPLLRHYHQALKIPTYSWEMCWDDYRMSIVFQTVWPIFFHSFVPTDRWYWLFECSMTAFEDLNCASFL